MWDMWATESPTLVALKSKKAGKYPRFTAGKIRKNSWGFSKDRNYLAENRRSPVWDDTRFQMIDFIRFHWEMIGSLPFRYHFQEMIRYSDMTAKLALTTCLADGCESDTLICFCLGTFHPPGGDWPRTWVIPWSSPSLPFYGWYKLV
jgi:hypothetical protein